jgi:hypothetical protein
LDLRSVAEIAANWRFFRSQEQGVSQSTRQARPHPRKCWRSKRLRSTPAPIRWRARDAGGPGHGLVVQPLGSRALRISNAGALDALSRLAAARFVAAKFSASDGRLGTSIHISIEIFAL